MKVTGPFFSRNSLTYPQQKSIIKVAFGWGQKAKKKMKKQKSMRTQTHNHLRAALLTIIILDLLTSSLTYADTAVSLGPYGTDNACAIDQSVQGWQFRVNKQITVTQLGLYDPWDDGFVQEYPIGLWRNSDVVLLTQGVLSAGEENPRIQNFRYCDVPDVILLPGNDYTIAFYTPIEAPTDTMAIYVTYGLVVDPSITIVGAREGLSNSGLIMPTHEPMFYKSR